LYAAIGQLPVKDFVTYIYRVINCGPQRWVLVTHEFFYRLRRESVYASFETFKVRSPAGAKDTLEVINVGWPEGIALVNEIRKQLAKLALHLDDGECECIYPTRGRV